MSQSLWRVYAHTVFSTKHRQPFLTNKADRLKLYGFMSSICKELNCPAIVIGGVEDHVHALTELSPKIAPAEFVKELKRISSLWIKTLNPIYEHFYWQNGYGIFSVSEPLISSVVEYINNQEERHKWQSYKDEFREICRENGVEINEKHAWD